MGKRVGGVLVSNTASVEDKIKEVRGAATSWTYSAADVQRIAREADARLTRMCLSATNSLGIVVTARSAGPSAAAYKYSVNGSLIRLVRARDGWRLLNYHRQNVYPREVEKIEIEISPVQGKTSADMSRRLLRVSIRATDVVGASQKGGAV